MSLTFSELDETSPLSAPNFDWRLNGLINLELVRETFIMTEKDNQRKCILSSPQENEFWTVRGYRGSV